MVNREGNGAPSPLLVIQAPPCTAARFHRLHRAQLRLGQPDTERIAAQARRNTTRPEALTLHTEKPFFAKSTPMVIVFMETSSAAGGSVETPS